MKEHEEVLQELDYVPFREDIAVEIPEGEVRDVQLHDGSHLRIRKLGRDFDPTNRMAALAAIEECRGEGRGAHRRALRQHRKPTFLELLNLPGRAHRHAARIPGAPVPRRARRSDGRAAVRAGGQALPRGAENGLNHLKGNRWRRPGRIGDRFLSSVAPRQGRAA
jgi:hypothetical protein